jgi:hypothetical protein
MSLRMPHSWQFGCNQASAAVAATMGKAKVTGQILDRTEVSKPGEFGAKTAEECAAAIVD